MFLEKWTSKVMLAACAAAALASESPAQVHLVVRPQSFVPADPAREVFNEGMKFYDEDRFNIAEVKFREVVRTFPRHPIADRADYYLIRTLAQVGKRSEALNRINAFPKQYRNSRWANDVEELRIQLTNRIPAAAESTLRTVVILEPTPKRPFEPVRVPTHAMPPLPLPAPVPMPFDGFRFYGPGIQISLQQEIMGVVFRNNFDRGLEIAAERLKANPVDPLVLSSLHLMAASASAQGFSMLVGIAKTSPNPRARRDAIFWMGQSKGDTDSIVDALIGLLPSIPEDDSEAIAYTLSQIRSDKSVNSLAAIARDRNWSEKVRNNAVFWIGYAHTPNRVILLEGIYKNSMDNAKIRQQALWALHQTRAPEAATVMGTAASSDPDMEVRKQAVFWLGQGRK